MIRDREIKQEPGVFKKYSKYIIRLIAFCVLFYLCFTYFYQDIRLGQLQEKLGSINSTEAFVFVLLSILCMPLNWLSEAKKWKIYMDDFSKISLKRAFIQVFQGISFGILTPGRIGEYLGRAISLESNQQSVAAVSTFVCSLAQNITNLCIGLIGFIVLKSTHWNGLDYPGIEWIMLLVMLLGVLMYLRVHKILIFLAGFPRLQKYLPTKLPQHHDGMNTTQLLSILFWALIRYAIYTLQYLFIWYALDAAIELTYMLACISMIYAIQSLVPLSPILQLTIRGSIALLVVTPLWQDKNSIMLASYGIWLLNLLVPAILGSIWLLISNSKTRSITQ